MKKLYTAVILFIIALAVALGLFFGLREGVVKEAGRMNILVMGIDASQGWEARSDSINLISFDFTRDRIGVLSIPRDSLVDIPGHGRDKINHAHMYGGPELSCRTVSQFLKVPVDYYLEINFPLFVSLIDQIGGVAIDVEKPLYYDDYAANLHIRLNPGVQKLTGYETMGYVRFRHDSASDWGRIERQHKFFRSIAEQFMQPGNIVKIFPLLLYRMSSDVRTNLNMGQLLKISLRAPQVYRYGRVDEGVVPGGDARLPGGYYMLSDPEGLKKEVDRVILGK